MTRDMSEPGGQLSPGQAKKALADRDAKDPNWRSRHYRDELTDVDAVPVAEDLAPPADRSDALESDTET